MQIRQQKVKCFLAQDITSRRQTSSLWQIILHVWTTSHKTESFLPDLKSFFINLWIFEDYAPPNQWWSIEEGFFFLEEGCKSFTQVLERGIEESFGGVPGKKDKVRSKVKKKEVSYGDWTPYFLIMIQSRFLSATEAAFWDIVTKISGLWVKWVTKNHLGEFRRKRVRLGLGVRLTWLYLGNKAS